MCAVQVNLKLAGQLATVAGASYTGDSYTDDGPYLNRVIAKTFGCEIQDVDQERKYARVDGNLIESTARLIRIPKKNGRHFGIICYNGVRPADLISIFGVLDLDAKQVSDSNWLGRVHSGFYRNFSATRDEFIEALERRVRELDELYITGHSLGGAMAMLMALTLATNATGICEEISTEINRRLKAVYTYGQPMIGDETFANYCEEYLGGKVFRFIYRQDVVPHLPPGKHYLPNWNWLGWRQKLGWEQKSLFKHFGREYRYGDYGHSDPNWEPSEEPTEPAGLMLLTVLPALLERRIVDPLVPNWLQSLKRRNKLSIDDHGPYNYIQALPR